MTAITFPNSPSAGDTHTAGNGIVYTYDGEKWTSIGTNSAGTWTRSGTEVSLTNAGDDLNVDSGSLFVDASTDRVGVGTTAPSSPLTVNQSSGNVNFELHSSSNGRGTQTKTHNDHATFFHGLAGDTTGDYIYYTADAKNHVFSTSNSEALRIDSSGNVGIGVNNPSSYYANGNDLVVGGTGSQGITIKSGSTNQGILAFAKGTSGGSEQYAGYILYNHGSGSAEHMQFAVGATERLRIDSSGRLLVGASSSFDQGAKIQASTTGYEVFEGFQYGVNSVAAILRIGKSRGSIGNHGLVAVNDQLGRISFMGNDGSSFKNAAYIFAAVDGTPGTNDMPTRLVLSTTANGAGSPTERMRITSEGHVFFGATTSFPTGGSNGGSAFVVESGNRRTLYLATTANAEGLIRFHNVNGQVGTVVVSGSSTSYNTSSDYRLKDNVVDIPDGITRVKQLQPKRFNFIADSETTVDGFLAHEAQLVVPEAVTGTKDEVDDDGNPVMQGIDQSKLVPLLTAALQEAIAKIETLEQRLSDAGIA